jgi:integrase/recombinase XerC
MPTTPDLRAFDVYLHGDGLSPTTRRAYLGHIRRWQESEEDDIVTWAGLVLADRPPGSASSIKSAVRKWWTFRGEPARPLPRGARPKRKVRHPLTDRQLGAYYRKVTHGQCSPQARVILRLLPRTGLRISEMCALQSRHLIRRGRVRLLELEGKGGHERLVALTREADRILTLYLKEHRPRRLAPDDYLFPGQWEEEPITPSAVRKALGKLRGTSTVTPHVLRHTWATRAHAAGVDILQISSILGHVNLETTRRYLSFGEETLLEAMEAAELKPKKRTPRKRTTRKRRT